MSRPSVACIADNVGAAPPTIREGANLKARWRGVSNFVGRTCGERRAMMYDPSLQWAVLELLATWKRLPLSDLIRMLQPIEQLRFRRELLDDMEYDGLVILRQAGDDLVLDLTPRGEARLQSGRPGDVAPGGGE